MYAHGTVLILLQTYLPMIFFIPLESHFHHRLPVLPTIQTFSERRKYAVIHCLSLSKSVFLTLFLSVFLCLLSSVPVVLIVVVFSSRFSMHVVIVFTSIFKLSSCCFRPFDVHGITTASPLSRTFSTFESTYLFGSSVRSTIDLSNGYCCS